MIAGIIKSESWLLCGNTKSVMYVIQNNRTKEEQLRGADHQQLKLYGIDRNYIQWITSSLY